MRIRPFALFPALLLAAASAHAHGDAPHDMNAMQAQSARVIEITMDDTMRFHPDQIAVRPGETVRLRIHNAGRDRKSTRLNSSHVKISYAVFCLQEITT